MATPELGHRMYGYTLLDCIVESVAVDSVPISSSVEWSKSSPFSSAVIFFSNSLMHSYSYCLILFNNWVHLESGVCSVLKLS